MTSEYYKNKKTNITYRIWKQMEDKFTVFKLSLNQYFDGLWECETVEEPIGEFKSMEECFNSMI